MAMEWEQVQVAGSHPHQPPQVATRKDNASPSPSPPPRLPTASSSHGEYKCAASSFLFKKFSTYGDALHASYAPPHDDKASYSSALHDAPSTSESAFENSSETVESLTTGIPCTNMHPINAYDLSSFEDAAASVEFNQFFPVGAMAHPSHTTMHLPPPPTAASASNFYTSASHAPVAGDYTFSEAFPSFPTESTQDMTSFGIVSGASNSASHPSFFDDRPSAAVSATVPSRSEHATTLPPLPTFPTLSGMASASTSFSSMNDADMSTAMLPLAASAVNTPPTVPMAARTALVSPMNSFVSSRLDENVVDTPKFSPDRRKLCCVEGCKSQARAFNRCKRHGGSKRCSSPGCTKSVQSRGLCIRHGGGSRCQESGCTRAAQSHGRCKMHGGGRPCIIEGCEKKAHLKRLCRKHGGGAKCSLPGCDKWAQRQGMCMTHSKHLTPTPPRAPSSRSKRMVLPPPLPMSSMSSACSTSSLSPPTAAAMPLTDHAAYQSAMDDEDKVTEYI